MNIALPILLLVVGSLTFWILSESTLKWYIKTTLIALFCAFTIFFYSTIHSFLGWAANQDDIPDKIAVHWIIIKEPNKFLSFDGKIYILIESAEQNQSKLLKLFGYKQSKIEPRLHEMKYSRKLHEELEKIRSKLKNGRPVIGKLTKEGDAGNSKKGTGKNKKGEGSESQEQEWHFHELLPSEIHRKPDE